MTFLNWCAEHWFLIFFLSAMGVFEGVRDFLAVMIEAIASIGGTRHKRRMKELRLQARIAAREGEGNRAAIAPVPGPCVHRNVVPVVSDEAVVAWLCRSCDTRLPADWAVREEDL